MSMENRVVHGDCLDVMPTLDAESIDAIVADPPYMLRFMGEAWDSPTQMVGHAQPDPNSTGFYGDKATGKQHDHGFAQWQPHPMQEWHHRWAVEALRVAKPGAYLLAFGGTRTYHRLACAIEDAGWEIRDCLVWAYASGFPKSHNLTGDRQGWGTALKPAWEPIILARKPLRGTVAANVQRFGTGALNVDGCRIGTGEGGDRDGEATASTRYTERGGTNIAALPGPRGGDIRGRWPANVILTDPIFDGDVPGVVGGGERPAGVAVRRNGQEPGEHVYGLGSVGRHERGEPDFGYGDSGTYSRFFLVPKASRSDREPVLGGLATKRRTMGSGLTGVSGDRSGRGGKAASLEMGAAERANHHPTVKPTELMRHLVRLVTPPGGIVLDPFLGSGTTALAAEMEGFRWLGIEREEEYLRIAEARLNGTQRGMAL